MPLEQSAFCEQTWTSPRRHDAAQDVLMPPPWGAPQQTSPAAQLSPPEHVST